MKQFVILSVLLVFSLPVGFSIAGCKGTNPNNYCNKTGYGYGLKTNQVAAINLPGNTTGISLAFGQTGQLGSPAPRIAMAARNPSPPIPMAQPT